MPRAAFRELVLILLSGLSKLLVLDSQMFSSPGLGARILPVGEIREHVLFAVGSRAYLICEK